MRLLFLISLLALLTGCASQSQKQAYWNSLRAEWKLEQDRVEDIYRSWFKKGFLEAWDGKLSVIETGGLTGHSTDPDGEWALQQGYRDGQFAAKEARVTYRIQEEEKTNP